MAASQTTTALHPYRLLPIEECNEPLVAIPKGVFAFFEPAPYQALGADYGGASPWMLRKGVLDDLIRAQEHLDKVKPGWKFKIFDAYRPNGVQEFMVNREFMTQARKAEVDPRNLTQEQQEELYKKVFRLWSMPNEKPQHPPPHSTGAVVDLTLVDQNGKSVDMGGDVDENSDRSNSDYYAKATNPEGKIFHANREVLREAMEAAGFIRLKSEWWHFSCDDQYAAWRKREAGINPTAVARYGRADLVPV